jgi:acetyl esterase/lipase
MPNTAAETPILSKYTKPAPDMPDVRYGPFARNVFDFWRGRTSSSPLVMFFHGGGFRRGDKQSLTGTFLQALQKEGYAVAAVNYRHSVEAPHPAQVLDGARALQFIRSRAEEFGIDPKRIALTGSSAGAGISQWIGFHDDLARPSSSDPVERQSTRVSVLGIFNAQSSYDPRFYRKLGLERAIIHPLFEPFFALSKQEIDDGPPQACRIFEDASPITHSKAGAPPVCMVYRQPDAPLPTDPALELPVSGNDTLQIANIAIHHPKLGYAMKEKLDELGIESEVHPGAGDRFPEFERKMVQFLKKHLH